MNKYHATSACFALLALILLPINTAQWVNHGGDLANRRARISSEPTIRTDLLKNLKLKWKLFTGADITATPAVANGVVYVPTWNGSLYAVDAARGSLVWKVNLRNLTRLSPPSTSGSGTILSRTTPSVAGDLLMVAIYGPGYLIGINRFTAKMVWKTELDPHPAAVITMSGTVYKGCFYVGVSSSEVTLPPERCCTFRGSMLKLNIQTGTILWKTFTIPERSGNSTGYAGGAIWGSSPSIDPLRNHVYVGTGQLYTAPQAVYDCQTTTNSTVNCLGTDVHVNSLVAYDLSSGILRWGTRLTAYDVFNYACLNPNSTSCPPGPNLDADFGEAPMLLRIRTSADRGSELDVAIAGQKSGFVWALDRNNGRIVWFNKAGPGGIEGGAIWGMATDGRKVYTNIINSDDKPFRLAPSNKVTTGGGWVALDANTGEIMWTTAVPDNTSTAYGPVTLVNDLLFAASVSPTGPLYAMDTRSGKIVWKYETGKSVQGGVSVNAGCVYVGNGVSAGLAVFHPEWTRGNTLFAFCAR